VQAANRDAAPIFAVMNQVNTNKRTWQKMHQNLLKRPLASGLNGPGTAGAPTGAPCTGIAGPIGRPSIGIGRP